MSEEKNMSVESMVAVSVLSCALLILFIVFLRNKYRPFTVTIYDNSLNNVDSMIRKESDKNNIDEECKDLEIYSAKKSKENFNKFKNKINEIITRFNILKIKKTN